ncbi:hypothetical protein ACP4OV_013830 [Aristida adscensionis]
MALKGIFRGLKIIAQIFTAQKEQEIEIGHPTDVRHVSHVGLGVSDGSCPSWMNEFRGFEEASAVGPAVSSAVQSRQTSWASLDFEQPVGVLLPAELSGEGSGRHDGGTPRGGRKKAARRRKRAGAASPGSSGRTPSWRSAASFATACDVAGEPPQGATMRLAVA